MPVGIPYGFAVLDYLHIYQLLIKVFRKLARFVDCLSYFQQKEIDP